MSYYQYMQSVYRSYLPQLNRSLRSSSVERLEGVRNQIRSTSVEATRNMRSSSVDRSNFYTSQLADTSRYMRSASVGPCENLYTFSSAMPFALEADKATERVMARRAASVEPVILPRKSFSYADHYASNCQPGAGYSAFDYKVGFLFFSKKPVMMFFAFNNEFIRCFHKFVSQIFISLSSWKRNFLLVRNRFCFSQFATSWKSIIIDICQKNLYISFSSSNNEFYESRILISRI